MTNLNIKLNYMICCLKIENATCLSNLIILEVGPNYVLEFNMFQKQNQIMPYLLLYTNAIFQENMNT